MVSEGSTPEVVQRAVVAGPTPARPGTRSTRDSIVDWSAPVKLLAVKPPPGRLARSNSHVAPSPDAPEKSTRRKLTVAVPSGVDSAPEQEPVMVGSFSPARSSNESDVHDMLS